MSFQKDMKAYRQRHSSFRLLAGLALILVVNPVLLWWTVRSGNTLPASLTFILLSVGATMALPVMAGAEAKGFLGIHPFSNKWDSIYRGAHKTLIVFVFSYTALIGYLYHLPWNLGVIYATGFGYLICRSFRRILEEARSLHSGDLLEHMAG